MSSRRPLHSKRGVRPLRWHLTPLSLARPHCLPRKRDFQGCLLLCHITKKAVVAIFALGISLPWTAPLKPTQIWSRCSFILPPDQPNSIALCQISACT